MKWLARSLERMRPVFQKGGRLHRLHPIFQAADGLLFSHPDVTRNAPYGRDALDVKRYMSFVILALLPSLLASVYFFGPRILLMLFVSYAAGGLVEVLFSVVRKEEINEGFLVTGFIFPLILPPGLPLWMVALGMIFGVLVGKEVFGGTGRNLFNAALLGRCFLLLGYPATMSASWVQPQPGHWIEWVKALPGMPVDAITGATPLVQAKAGVFASLGDLFVGQVAGSAGETSALAILIGGALLLATRVASYRTILGALGGFAITGALLHFIAPDHVNPITFNFLSGGFLFGAFFMATDPVTSPITGAAKWTFGIIIGAVTILIRSFSGYMEGAMFAILLGNILAPLLDEVVIRMKMRSFAGEE